MHNLLEVWKLPISYTQFLSISVKNKFCVITLIQEMTKEDKKKTGEKKGNFAACSVKEDVFPSRQMNIIKTVV